jgi:flagellar hook-associated protein 1 FlgK
MSLSIAGSIAYTALRATNVQMSVASNNIANADTDGYTVKTATKVATVAGGTGTGTAISAITSSVDRYVFAHLLAADGAAAAATTTADYTDQLQSLFGSTSGGADDAGTSIANTLADLETAVTALASTPESATAKAGLIDAADDLATQLRQTSASIQSLRADADGAIADAVDSVNDAMKTIDSLNTAIVAAKAQGQSTADLQDQLNTALRGVASYLDIQTTTTSTGAVHVYTSGGTALVTASVHELEYEPASAVGADTAFDTITVGGKSIEGAITSGKLDALLTLRDETLPAAEDALDSLAATLITTLNAVTADGSAVPAPTTLTGTKAVAAGDAFSATGSVRIALVDTDGAVAGSTDLDLSAYSTVDELLAGLNGIDGVSASLNTDGTLSLTATDGASGIAVGAGDSAVGASGASFSGYFGFNALLTGSGAADIAVSNGLVADASGLATAVLGDSGLASGDTTIADALADALTGKRSFAAAGGLAAQKTSFTDYAAAIVADVADRASDAATNQTAKETVQATLANTLASATGVNLDEETAKLSEYETLYNAAAQVISIANELFKTLLDVVESAG